MTPVTSWFSRTHHLRLWLAHRLRALVGMPRPLHLHLTGPDVSGMHHLVEQLRGLGPAVWVADTPSTPRDGLGVFRPVVVTWHADDWEHANEVVDLFRGLRTLHVVCVVADPRDLVCGLNPAVPNQYADGFDYRMLVGPSGLRSFTEPGVLERFRGIEAWRGALGDRLSLVSRSELETDTAAAVGALARRVIESPGSPLLAEITSAGSRADSMPVGTKRGESEATKRRRAQQLALCPELETLATDYGYAPIPASQRSTKSKVTKPGTVIAFHTPDEIYRAEAERLRSSLDALGVKYRFYEVTPEKNWVRTTLLKPSWIIPARGELAGPLLYIDVDAYVHADPWPYLAQYDGDMAAVVYRNGQLNSATLWINDTPGAREILERWKNLADARRGADQGDLEATGDNGDQGVLKEVVLGDEQSATPRFRFQRLPVNLAYIFDRTDTYCVGPVLIEQLQASRESLGHDKRLARRRARLQELQS